MSNIKTAIITSKKSWFVPYAYTLVDSIISKGVSCELFFDHRNVEKSFDIVFLLSYFRLVKSDFLHNNTYNVVVHESDLPQGRGWAPFFWQVIEGKNTIPVVLFEASSEMDEGDIYLKSYIQLEGHELHDELREKQSHVTMELVEEFIDKFTAGNLTKTPQKGEPTYYPKRSPKDSNIDVYKTIAGQFNLFRLANNDYFPAYFEYLGHNYVLRIEKVEYTNEYLR